ncbi:hypothetical protein HMPREF9508_02778 [Enterococcus faecalis TX0312]|nr:hypothetical protein HMPREF9508_02778 [Enterococcus faecalis TX0312]
MNNKSIHKKENSMNQKWQKLLPTRNSPKRWFSTSYHDWPLRPVRRDKGQANFSIPSLAFIGLAGMVHRKKGRHEEN